MAGFFRQLANKFGSRSDSTDEDRCSSRSCRDSIFWVTQCGHHYCRDCFRNIKRQYRYETWICGACQSPISTDMRTIYHCVNSSHWCNIETPADLSPFEKYFYNSKDFHKFRLNQERYWDQVCKQIDRRNDPSYRYYYHAYHKNYEAARQQLEMLNDRYDVIIKNYYGSSCMKKVMGLYIEMLLSGDNTVGIAPDIPKAVHLYGLHRSTVDCKNCCLQQIEAYYKANQQPTKAIATFIKRVQNMDSQAIDAITKMYMTPVISK